MTTITLKLSDIEARVLLDMVSAHKSPTLSNRPGQLAAEFLCNKIELQMATNNDDDQYPWSEPTTELEVYEPSRSRDIDHKVTLRPNGNHTCECEAFTYRYGPKGQQCRHITNALAGFPEYDR